MAIMGKPKLYRSQKIAVVIPALNEQELILRTLRDVPSTIDSFYVIDDGSEDRTLSIIREYIPKMDVKVKVVSPPSIVYQVESRFNSPIVRLNSGGIS